MAQNIPTTEEIYLSVIANIEAKINQTTPSNNKAYNDVIARSLAGVITILYKFGAERTKQVLALTATGDDLKALARNYDIEPKGATSAVLVYDVNSTSTVPQSIDWVGDANGVRYTADGDAVPVTGVATITGTAQTSGTVGNLDVGDTLSIGSNNPGTESTATITSVDTIGADEETDEALRTRLLDKIRAEGGGGNSADYRVWAQETEGVTRAYPYAGNPTFLTEGTGSALPGERTVFIEADESIDIDGIAPQSLLDDARESIRFDPDDNNRAREPLPLTNDTLYVESIRRTQFFVTVTNLDVNVDVESQTKNNISTALDTYFKALEPFIDGLDAESEKNNVITEATVGSVVQNVAASVGGNVESVGFDIGLSGIPSYTLEANEKAKLGGVTYV